MKQWLNRIKAWTQDQKGLGLTESVIAVAVLGVAIVTFVAALATGSLAVSQENEQVVAQSLVRTQLEYIKNYPYDPSVITYPTVDAPKGFSICVTVGFIPNTDTDIQKITVTIYREGEEILSVEDYKVNR